jgi:hypothetical protein
MGLVAAALLLGGCLSDEPSPSAPASLAPVSLEPAASPSPQATPSPSPLPTPNQADVPVFAAGAMVTTRTVVHVRDLPGTRWGVAANLQAGSLLQVVVGPIRTGGFGWYLLRDADSAAPAFREGWVAAGFVPDAFLAPQPAATPAPDSPTFVAGYADVTDGEFGPFRLEGSTALRWALAIPPGLPAGASCQFAGSLAPEGGKAVSFLKTSVAQTPAPGTVQPSFFANHPTLRGDLFLHVSSDCSWAVSVVRLPL